MARENIVDIVTAEIKRHHLIYTVECGGRHYKIRFQVRERWHMYVVPKTASDHRSALNCRAGIRRLLRELLK